MLWNEIGEIAAALRRGKRKKAKANAKAQPNKKKKNFCSFGFFSSLPCFYRFLSSCFKSETESWSILARLAFLGWRREKVFFYFFFSPLHNMSYMILHSTYGGAGPIINGRFEGKSYRTFSRLLARTSGETMWAAEIAASARNPETFYLKSSQSSCFCNGGMNSSHNWGCRCKADDTSNDTFNAYRRVANTCLTCHLGESHCPNNVSPRSEMIPI